MAIFGVWSEYITAIFVDKLGSDKFYCWNKSNCNTSIDVDVRRSNNISIRSERILLIDRWWCRHFWWLLIDWNWLLPAWHLIFEIWKQHRNVLNWKVTTLKTETCAVIQKVLTQNKSIMQFVIRYLVDSAISHCLLQWCYLSDQGHCVRCKSGY